MRSPALPWSSVGSSCVADARRHARALRGRACLPVPGPEKWARAQLRFRGGGWDAAGLLTREHQRGWLGCTASRGRSKGPKRGPSMRTARIPRRVRVGGFPVAFDARRPQQPTGERDERERRWTAESSRDMLGQRYGGESTLCFSMAARPVLLDRQPVEPFGRRFDCSFLRTPC